MLRQRPFLLFQAGAFHSSTFDLLRARPASVKTAPGSNRTLDDATLARAKDIFATYEFPHKRVLHNWRFFLKAGKASTGPPVGQEFAKLGLKAMDFAKSFNDRTKPIFKDDVELIVRIQVYFDKSYFYRIEPPPTAWFIMRSIRRKRGETGQVPLRGAYCALMTLEMCYEIAKMKGIRNFNEVEEQPIEIRVRRIVGQARRMGVAIIGIDTAIDSPLGRQDIPDDHDAYMKQVEFYIPHAKRPPMDKTSADDAQQAKKHTAEKGGKGGASPQPPAPSKAAHTAGGGSRTAVALTPKAYKALTERYRVIHMQQYEKLRQDQLDEAPLYERLQYAHRYFPANGPRTGGAEKAPSHGAATPAPVSSIPFSRGLLRGLTSEQLEEGLRDARLFNALWRLHSPRSAFQQREADKAAALTYVHTRGWMKEMSREEMAVTYGLQQASGAAEPIENPFAISRDENP